MKKSGVKDIRLTGQCGVVTAEVRSNKMKKDSEQKSHLKKKMKKPRQGKENSRGGKEKGWT